MSLAGMQHNEPNSPVEHRARFDLKLGVLSCLVSPARAGLRHASQKQIGCAGSLWLEAELLAERDVVKVRFHAGRVTTVYSEAYFQLAVRVLQES